MADGSQLVTWEKQKANIYLNTHIQQYKGTNIIHIKAMEVIIYKLKPHCTIIGGKSQWLHSVTLNKTMLTEAQS